MKIDLEAFRQHEKDKLISCRPHSKGKLLIWNYTPRAQFDRVWDDVTTQARGLITDLEGNIKARPFRKFFNFGEHPGAEELSLAGATVTEKYDGSLGNGRHVMVDDTNLHPKHEERLKELAEKHGATFATRKFKIDVEECIKRDLKRENSVGEQVIRQMYDQFLRVKEVYEPPKGKPEAILVDLDGTLAHMSGRSPYDWSRVGEDAVDKAVIELLFDIRAGDFDTKIIILSGRDSVCRPETETWLEEQRIGYDDLFMRPEGDMRKDSIVKRELFDIHIRDSYEIRFVLDDRDQVVQMWRDLGLKCFQVAEGAF